MGLIEDFVNSVCEYHEEAESMHGLSVNTPENANILSDSGDLQKDIEQRVEKIALAILNKTEAMLESEKQLAPWEKDLLNRCKTVLGNSAIDKRDVPVALHFKYKGLLPEYIKI